MIRNSLKSGYNVGEDHSCLGSALTLGKTVDVVLLKCSFLLIDSLLKIDNILKMSFIALCKDLHGISDYGIYHIKHFPEFPHCIMR